MRGYDWQGIAEKLGFKSETEMWNGLYPKLLVTQITEIINKYEPSIIQQTIRVRMRKCGVKMNKPGGYHNTEKYLHRKKVRKKKRKCRRCGCDPYPNWFLCESCQSKLSTIYAVDAAGGCSYELPI